MRFVGIGFAHGHIDSVVRGFRAMPGVELVGIWDADPHRLADRQAKLGVPAFADYREMLDATKPHFAAVCPANCDKGDVIAECAARGVHVFADKPLVIRRPDLEKAETAVRRSGIEAWAYLTLRYSPPFYTIAQRIAGGEIGEVVSVYAAGPHKLNLPMRTREMLDADLNGGVLVDLGSHDIDLARWYIGREPVDVVATMACRRFTQVPNFYDTAQAFFRFEGNIPAYIEESWLQPDASRGDRRCLVVGTQGTLEYRACDDALILTTVTRGEERLTPERPPVSGLQDFLDTIQGKGSGRFGTADSFAGARAGVAAHEAAITGERVRVH